MHRGTLSLLAVVAFVPSLLSARTASAQGAPPSPPLGRVEVIERVKRENTSALAARHRLSASRAAVVAAGVWPNPNVSATALFLTHGAVTGGNQEFTVSVDQVVPVAGQVGLRKDVARGYSSAEERAYAATLWQLVEDARVAYVDLQRAQARARVVRAGLADLSRVESIVETRSAAGATSPYDRVRVGVERSRMEARVASAEAETVTARAALAQAIGKSVDARTVAADDDLDDVTSAPADVDALVRRALAQRPEVGSARARTDASELRVSLLRRQYVPSPDLSVGYARYVDVPGVGNGGAVLAGVSFPVPLFDHGQGTVDRGLAEAAEERARKEGVELAVRREVEGAAGVLAVRAAAWKKFKETVQADVEKLRTTAELSYREGRASILELLDAYNAYVDAQERRIDLQAGAARAALDLDRALGPSAGGL
jgi:cobalt-zinc-cadmium efflux system outer membrane protein